MEGGLPTHLQALQAAAHHEIQRRDGRLVAVLGGAARRVGGRQHLQQQPSAVRDAHHNILATPFLLPWPEP